MILPSLLVIEPNLRDPSGHYAEFVRAVGSRISGAELEIFAHPDADAMMAGMAGVRVSNSSPRVGEPLAEWRKIYRSIAGRSNFLLLTADGRHAAAASIFAQLTGKEPSGANFFFHRAPTTSRDKLLYPLTRKARECCRAITSTRQIADILKELGWKRVEYVPYPALGAESQPKPVPFSHLLMAGAARLNKGLDLVAELSVQWAAQGRSVPLFVQTSRKHANRHGKREESYVNMLLSSGYKGLRCDAAAPGRAEYLRRFHGAIVLAPYTLEQFATQVSGVILDGLLHGAPAVATKGTWPAIQVERFGAGVTIADRTSGALADAIDMILNNWDHYSQRACEAAQVLAEEHDPIHLVKMLGIGS